MRALRLIAVAAGAFLAGCGGAAPAERERTEVIAAVYPLAWAAQEVGGEGVSVRNLTPPGAEPHDLELSARDVERVRGADLVLYLGSGFQPALETAAEGSRAAVDLLAGLELHTADDDGHGHEESTDPHVWLDPVLFAQVVRRIGDELARPTEAERLAERLEALDREYRDGLRSCVRREIVTSHAAFGYLTERYGLEQISIAGLSPEAEPNARRLAEVVERVREVGATTIFFETLVSPRVAETVARETGTDTAVLNPLESLSEEELDRGDDYVSVMRRNLRTLREALACS